MSTSINSFSFPNSCHSSSDTASTPKKKPAKKALRTWDDSLPTETDGASLDYSSPAAPIDENRVVDVSHLVDQSSFGVRDRNGLYEVKDLDFGGDEDDEEENDEDDIIARALQGTSLGRTTSGAAAPAPAASSRLGTFGSLFSRLTGSKPLTKADLEPILAGMKDHLMQKNVAQEIAIKICEGIGESLVGKRVSGFRGKLDP